MNIKHLSWIFVFVLISSLVLSVSPNIPTQQDTDDWVILYPKVQTIKVNEDFMFEMHVLDLNKQVKNISNSNCILHVYNSSGNLILKNTEFGYDYPDWNLNILGSNFTIVGDYYYNLWCSNNTNGGYVSDAFSITNSGIVEDYNNDSFFSVILVFLFLNVLVIIGMFSTDKNWLKLILGFALSITLTSLFRFAAWFIEITNPTQVGLIKSINQFYMFGINGMVIVATITALSITILLLYILFQRKGPKGVFDE